MSPTRAESFFSLDNYIHKDLFSNIEHVWEALDHLPAYLQSSSLGLIEIDVPEMVTLVNKHQISIAKGCIIEPGCYIQGPCILSEGTAVRHGAYVRGNVITGKNCVIGHATEVKNSIFLDNAAAPHFNYVGDSILGNHTNLGAGVVCANLRLDKKNIHVIIAGRAFDTARQKMGLIAGDFSSMGCNSVSNPGTLLGRESMCFPCVNVSGYIPKGSLVKGQQFSVEAR